MRHSSSSWAYLRSCRSRQFYSLHSLGFSSPCSAPWSSASRMQYLRYMDFFLLILLRVFNDVLISHLGVAIRLGWHASVALRAGPQSRHRCLRCAAPLLLNAQARRFVRRHSAHHLKGSLYWQAWHASECRAILFPLWRHHHHVHRFVLLRIKASLHPVVCTACGGRGKAAE